MSTILHFASALAAVVLFVLLAKTRRQLLLVRQVLSPRKVFVEDPRRFLQEFCASMGVMFEAHQIGTLEPRRIDPAVLRDLFVGGYPTLVRCSKPTDSGKKLLVSLSWRKVASNEAGAGAKLDVLATNLTRALGDDVRVEVVHDQRV